MNTDNIDIEINPDYTMHRKLENGLFLSPEEIDILEAYNIDYMSKKSLADLIYDLEEIVDDTDDDVLANLLDTLAERNYYENTNK